MARRRAGYTSNNARRALGRIEVKARERVIQRGRDLVRLIALYCPRDPDHAQDTGGIPLWKSYYVRSDPATGDILVSCRRRYWAFVEFGTAKHGRAQPHIRPALRALKRVNKR